MEGQGLKREARTRYKCAVVRVTRARALEEGREEKKKGCLVFLVSVEKRYKRTEKRAPCRGSLSVGGAFSVDVEPTRLVSAEDR